MTEYRKIKGTDFVLDSATRSETGGVVFFTNGYMTMAVPEDWTEPYTPRTPREEPPMYTTVVVSMWERNAQILTTFQRRGHGPYEGWYSSTANSHPITWEVLLEHFPDAMTLTEYIKKGGYL